MIRKIAIALLLAAVGYVGWVIALNLPGQGGPAPAEQADRAPVRAPPVGTGKHGALVIPVAGIPAAQLVDTFDDARGEGRVHDAIDIMAPRGTPVIAAAAGTVEKLFTSERGGLTVYIRRPTGQWTAMPPAWPRGRRSRRAR